MDGRTWFVSREQGLGCKIMEMQEDGNAFCIGETRNGEKRNEGKINARRIVACVNACLGISTELLEQGGIGTVEDLMEKERKQRMELDILNSKFLTLRSAVKDIAEDGDVFEALKALRNLKRDALKMVDFVRMIAINEDNVDSLEMEREATKLYDELSESIILAGDRE